MGDLLTRRRATTLLASAAGCAGIATGKSGPAAAVSRSVRPMIVDSRPEAFQIEQDKTAVLVIDMQNDFGAKGGMFDRAGIDISGIQAVVPNVRLTLAAARTAGLPIFFLKMAFRPDLSDVGPLTGPNWLKHAPLQVGKPMIAPDGSASRILIRDTWNTSIIPELTPKSGDSVLYKSRFSSFFKTALHDQLRRRGIDTLVITGCTTSVCVESTIRDAMFLDYRCLVLEDCTAEPIGAHELRTNHQASLLAMQILFAWISDSEKFVTALSAA